ncbi:hypothetical protein HYH03_001191 [Edaphochlamys debaryana]|uniref:Uncharacterized protein n=1 Tax=Edaphochlamys debaryana TaxID=47281 RepID=A0A835YEK2_9CHLO|nr:hypothetical protein HYH03_001191 [Edaphochlamys debaryana]|eukprot:KAG2501405.1 hypothetical protein HYH03_001191 [Edaphochlamys debaryana]
MEDDDQLDRPATRRDLLLLVKEIREDRARRKLAEYEHLLWIKEAAEAAWASVCAWWNAAAVAQPPAPSAHPQCVPRSSQDDGSNTDSSSGEAGATAGGLGAGSLRRRQHPAPPPFKGDVRSG